MISKRKGKTKEKMWNVEGKNTFLQFERWAS